SGQARKQHVPPPTASAVRADAVPAQMRQQQAKPLTPPERMPHGASRDHLYVDYDRPHVKQAPQARLPGAAAAASCDVNGFAAASGSSLVNLVRNVSVDGCINTLFGLSSTTAGEVFGEAKMVTIADALRSIAVSYAGNND